MALLILGLALFFGVHAVTMARGLRARLIDRLGPGPYRGLYSIGSGIGFALIVWGFVVYRLNGYIPVWEPPRGMTHVAMTLMLPAMALLFVYLLPPGRIKAATRHPMLVMLKIWALAHLLVNGDLGSIILFGSFLAYAVADRIALKRRGDAAPAAIAWNRNDALAAALGIAAYLAVVFWLHPILFGVPVLPGR